MRIHSYPSIYNLGHKAIQNIFDDPIEISCKIDGSQISFTKSNGEYFARSKGQDLNFAAPEKMFLKAIQSIETLDLKDGLVYRGEYLLSPKHNCLNYNRVPNKHIILFNIEKGDQDYLSYNDMVLESTRIGLEVVPLVYYGKITSIDKLKELMNKESYLGGPLEEGLVLKNYFKFGPDKKVLMAKIVRDDFKEINAKNWKNSNPTKLDIIQELILEYKTEARWNKSIQHLREKGEITDSPKDIGPLIKEIRADIEKECVDEIKDKLWNRFKDQILRGSISGFPEFYKNKLVESI